MNHIYRVIFNRHTNTFQAVAETAKSQGKTHSQKSSNSSTTVSKLVLRPLSVVIGLLVGSVAVAAPTGGEVVAGVANIHQAGNITNINQSSQNAAINWQQFGIKAHETVNFNQPNVNAVTLNRVIGNEKSVIDGAMNANGKVFIQNANGTLIGKNAQINVGGLVATTAKISDEDFMSGNYRFTGATGSIENLGDIKVPKGGVVALIAPIVKNSGTITAHGADTLLASAESFSITLPNDGQFSYTLDKGTLQGLVDNGGAILADGGRVVLTTKGIDTVKKSIIKHSGIIEANTIKNNNGVIELLGDLDNSELHLTGTLKAEGKGTDDGGFIETSAAKLNIDDKAYISTQAEQGKTGIWLIDPKDFTVAPSGGDVTGKKVSEDLKSNNVQLKSKSHAIGGKGDVIINDEINWDKNKLTITADNDIHINKTLNGTGKASLALEYGQNTENGVRETYTNGKTVRYYANYYLDKNTPLKNRTVKINLPVGKTFSTKQGMNGEVEVYDVIHEMPKIVKGSDGDWESQFTTDKIAFGSDVDVSHTKNHEGFAGWELPKNKYNKPSAKIHGLGHVVDGLWLRSKKANQTTGLFPVNDDGVLRRDYSVLRDIGVTNVDIQSQGKGAHAGGLVGVGSDVHNSYATGTVSTTGELAHAGGLVGVGSDVHNSYATGTVSTTGELARAGGLVGSGHNIHNSYATGNVSTENMSGYAGGLVGSGHNIHNSYATGNVSTTSGGAYAGGLVGKGRYIHNSYATGNVSSIFGDTGGLVGTGDNIYNSYATGNVSTTGGGTDVGGLVGNGSDIHNSYATGNVSTTGGGTDVGGLVGNGSDIHNSYATGNVSAISSNTNAGGLAGRGNNIHNSYANNQVSATSKYYVWQGGVIGYYNDDSPSKNTFFNQSKNPTLKAVGEYSSRVDQSQVKNLTGKTEAELKQKVTFKDWDFDKVWRISEGSDMPRLRALTEGKITIDGKDLLIKGVNLSKTYNGEPILTYDELSSLKGWKENGIIAVGMLSGDKLSDQSIFTGRLTLGGTWQGAVDVGDYTIIPSGLSSQKYEIEYQNGTLTINPRQISLMGTRPYNATSMVKVDKNTKIIGDILPKDQGKLTISGSSKIVKSISGRFEDAQDVGTYRLLGGNLAVSSKNYIINPATSQWTITPKTIYLTGSANADDKKVVASQVDLNQLGIESVDKGKVSLTGQGTLNNNNKLANGHSFKLVGSEAGNYKLNTTLAWKIISNPKPIEEPSTPSDTVTTSPSTTLPDNTSTPNNKMEQQEKDYLERFSRTKDLVENAERIHQEAEAKMNRLLKLGQNVPLGSLNSSIQRAVNEAKQSINTLRDGVPKEILRKRLGNIYLLRINNVITNEARIKKEISNVNKRNSNISSSNKQNHKIKKMCDYNCEKQGLTPKLRNAISMLDAALQKGESVEMVFDTLDKVLTMNQNIDLATGNLSKYLSASGNVRLEKFIAAVDAFKDTQNNGLMEKLLNYGYSEKNVQYFMHSEVGVEHLKQFKDLGKLQKGAVVLGKFMTALSYVKLAKDLVQTYDVAVQGNLNAPKVRDLVMNNVDVIPFVGSGLSLVQTSLKLGELRGGDLGAAADMDIDTIKINIDTFSNHMQSISDRLYQGKITQKQAEVEFYQAQLDAGRGISQINDHLLISNNNTNWTNFKRGFTIWTMAVTGREDKLSERQKSIDMAFKQLDQYKFDDLVQMVELRKLSNINF